MTAPRDAAPNSASDSVSDSAPADSARDAEASRASTRASEPCEGATRADGPGTPAARSDTTAGMGRHPEAAKPRRPFDRGFAVVALLAVLSGAGVWVRLGPEAFWEILLEDLGFAAVLLPKIAGGILLATALGMVLPRERILQFIGPDSGLRGLLIATAAGALIPGGPAVTYPLTAGLMLAGADIGAGVALISGWVLLSLNRTLVWELSFLPHDLVALRVLLTLPAPLLLGWAARLLWRRSAAAVQPAQHPSEERTP